MSNRANDRYLAKSIRNPAARSVAQNSPFETRLDDELYVNPLRMLTSLNVALIMIRGVICIELSQVFVLTARGFV